MTSGYTRAVNDLMGEVDRMDDLATPRPWYVGHSYDGSGWVDIGHDSHTIASARNDETETNKANAALIVKAVNAYDSLTAENQRLSDALLAALELVARIADQQAMPDDSWKAEARKLKAVYDAALKGASK